MTLEEIKNKNRKIREKMLSINKIDKANLSKELRQVSSHIYLIGERKIGAEYAMDKAEAKYELIKSRVDKKIRSGTKKHTEKEVLSKVVRNPEVIKAYDDYLEAKYLYGLFGIGLMALAKKCDMLSNISYNYRKELNRNLVTESKEEELKQKSRQHRVIKGE